MSPRSRTLKVPQSLTVGSLPLDSVRHFFGKPEPEQFRSLCSVLAAIAGEGREDALTLLFGLAYRNRHDLVRMLYFVRAVRSLEHPELVSLLASELTRVPSTPQSRTYLTAVLDTLFQFHTAESGNALLELSNDPLVGSRYRVHIREHLSRLPSS
jgi:hypothetical protein